MSRLFPENLSHTHPYLCNLFTPFLPPTQDRITLRLCSGFSTIRPCSQLDMVDGCWLKVDGSVNGLLNVAALVVCGLPKGRRSFQPT